MDTIFFTLLIYSRIGMLISLSFLLRLLTYHLFCCFFCWSSFSMRRKNDSYFTLRNYNSLILLQSLLDYLVYTTCYVTLKIRDLLHSKKIRNNFSMMTACCVANPILYAFLNPEFRKSLMRRRLYAKHTLQAARSFPTWFTDVAKGLQYALD